LEERQLLLTICREQGVDLSCGILQPNTQKMWGLNRELAEIRKWATSNDDDDWMNRRHRAMMVEADEIIASANEFMEGIHALHQP
jgi:hypothetical protein